MGQKRKASLIALSFVLAGSMPGVAQSEQPQKYVDLWQQENSLCRGSSDPTIIEASCTARDVYQKKLKEMNWCYGKKGEAGHQLNWHRCTSSSNR